MPLVTACLSEPVGQTISPVSLGQLNLLSANLLVITLKWMVFHMKMIFYLWSKGGTLVIKRNREEKVT